EERPPSSPREAVERVERLLDRVPLLLVRQLPVALVGVVCAAQARAIGARLGDEQDALLITRGLPHNPTTEMDLELWAIAARLRGDADLARLVLETPPAELAARSLAGQLPPPLRDALAGFLARYGFRGVAEIDLGQPRWRDDPTYVFGVLANYLRLDDPRQ